MKNNLQKMLITFCIALGLAMSSGVANANCRWVNGYWSHGWYHHGHRVCWGPVKHCGWHNGVRTCWYR